MTVNKVVVTGATSMLGVALIEACIERNVKVLAFVRPHSAHIDRISKFGLVEVIECDLSELQQYQPSVGDCDVFYHFGWTYTDRDSLNDVTKQEKNIAYTLDALRLAKRMGCKKFVGAGSQLEYGSHVDEQTTPYSPTNPINAYGISKYAAGKLALLLAEELEMDCFWVRIFSVFGKYESENTMLSTSIAKMVRGEYCSFTPATHSWDYLYSSDVGEALYFVGEKASGTKVYCLGSGQSRVLKDYIESVQDIINPEMELGFGDIPYKEGVKYGFCPDISDLVEDTGWQPCISFEEGIRKCYTGGNR